MLLPCALGCIKASFLLFYRRVFVVNKKSGVNVVLISLLVIVILWTLAFSLTTLFWCGRYFYMLWEPVSGARTNTHCANTLSMILVFCITDFITDFVIILIPIPLASTRIYLVACDLIHPLDMAITYFNSKKVSHWRYLSFRKRVCTNDENNKPRLNSFCRAIATSLTRLIISVNPITSRLILTEKELSILTGF